MNFEIVKAWITNNLYFVCFYSSDQKMSIEIESAEYVFSKTKSNHSVAYFELIFVYSVVRLIQQYLKESNLNKTLQTLQVKLQKIHVNFSEHID